MRNLLYRHRSQPRGVNPLWRMADETAREIKYLVEKALGKKEANMMKGRDNSSIAQELSKVGALRKQMSKFRDVDDNISLNDIRRMADDRINAQIRGPIQDMKGANRVEQNALQLIDKLSGGHTYSPNLWS